MKTQKPISTISYNTIGFLQSKLSLLVEDGSISEYWYIQHWGENCDKDHIHLFIIPARSLDTSSLRECFSEPSALWYENDLGCMPFIKSDFYNWFLYSLHDVTYLMLKKEVKYEHYSIEDFVTNSSLNVGNVYKLAFAKLCETDNISILEKLENGYSPSSLIREGYSPQAIGQVYRLLQSENLYINTINSARRSSEILQADVSKLIAENHQLKNNEEFVNSFLTTFCTCDTLTLDLVNTNNVSSGG